VALELLHARARFALAVGTQQDDAGGIACGQEHAVRFFAANHGRLKIVDNNNLATDQRVGRVMAADSSDDLLLDFSHLHLKQQQLVGVGMFAGSDNLGDPQFEFGEVGISDGGFCIHDR
jgi:hypothetical protein